MSRTALADFTLLDQSDLPGPEQPLRRQMLARRTH